MPNKEITKDLDDIKRLIEDGEMSFLIGAGFSRNVNKEAYPMWGDLLKDAAWKLFGDGTKGSKAKKQKTLEKVEKDMGYLGLASLLVKKSGYHEAIDTYIESKTPYLKTVGGKKVLLLNGVQLQNTISSDCHNLLKQLDIQNIYTFNYDNALEFFLGEEARQELENEICGIEDEINVLRRAKRELKQKEDNLKGQMSPKSMNEKKSSAGIVEVESENLTIYGKLSGELKDIQKELEENKTQEQELRVNLETKKQGRKTYYNVVKDSYDISLSARRKSIYKIHGSLRGPNTSEYGFDGDAHTQYIITQEDYDTYNEKHSAFVSMMRIDLLRSRFCIMGVSGGDANFLAWINWVKDVLDKTKARLGNNNEKHQSYFIYSSSDEMPKDMILMLRNHFIEPVILKDVFPSCKNDEERIKSFLEYIQPLNNDEVSSFADMWGEVFASRFPGQNNHVLSKQVVDTLFRLSTIYKYNTPKSITQDAVVDVQFDSNYLRTNASEEDRKIYAAAMTCSLLPLDVTCDSVLCNQMENEPNPNIRKAFLDALCRMALLKNIDVKVNKKVGNREYALVLQRLYDYQFPTADEINNIRGDSGIDFVRRYSLLHMLHVEKINAQNCETSDFSSPQELVLAMDWMKTIGYKNPALYRKADEYKSQDRVMSLSDYCHAYLDSMKRKKEINTYGNTEETIYLDKYSPNVVNAAILLNSYVELGICFAGQSLLSDNEWLDIVKSLKTRYTEALICYTILRTSQEKVIKVVAQEIMYDENSRKVLSSVLRNQIKALIADTTPKYLKAGIAKFAAEILPAINVKHWSACFIAHAEEILNYADECDEFFGAKKSIYRFVSKALKYVKAKELRIRLLKRVLEKSKFDDRFEDYYNDLVISARKKLKPADFAPLLNTLIDFAEKIRISNSQLGYFIVLNLMLLVEKKQKQRLLAIIKEKAILDAELTEGYASQIENLPDLKLEYKKNFVKGEDFWHSGITKGGVHIGIAHVNVSRIDKALHFNDDQVRIIYNDLKTTLPKIDRVIQRDEKANIDRGWMSSQNNFRELVMDMSVFISNHDKQLKTEPDYTDTHKTLKNVYERCFLMKRIHQLIAEDEIYKAVRRIMVETEMYGIEHYRLEYEQLICRIITKDTTELGIAFRHVAWAMGHYGKFFNSRDFKQLFAEILEVYKPYFIPSAKEQRSWDLVGSQKEIAEKCLVNMAKKLSTWGYTDVFWSKYKRTYYDES